VIEKFHLELPLRVLFDSPTVEKMAAAIRETQSLDHQPGELRSPTSSPALPERSVGPTIDFTPFPKEDVERSIPERFEKMVTMYPDRPAVKMGPRSLIYEQLNQAANRIARVILEMRGPGSEPIALLFEHGTEVIAPILGVLKAGKFFVSLDPTFPMEWNRYVCEDSGSRVIITDRHNAVIARSLAKELDRLIIVEDLDTASSVANFGVYIAPSALACLIYTSGSTGTPKAVIQNHRNFLHATMRRINSFHISVADRLTLLSSGFNQALMNIFSALLSGACVCPFNAKKASAGELVRWLEDEGITIYHSSASLFRQVRDTLTGNEDLSRIRLVRSASEAVTKGDVKLFRKHFSPKCIYVNGLSTTETGTATLSFIDQNTPIATERVPIGYPLQDIEVLLLDDGGQPVPTGHTGEIAIRSSYLSPGYWRRADLTAAKFLADPQGGHKRIFLTGDLGRELNDGCVEHLGRKDFRLKIRGYPVESGDVETKLLDHPGVKEVAVIGHEAQTGQTRLIAYIVPTQRPGPNVTEFRSFLSKALPDFMIPSLFVALDNLPRTLNGKVDRRALPDFAHSRPDLDHSFVPPRHTIERELARIWEDVLALDQIGIHDNFFDLGGHSLAATRIVTRVIEKFHLELPLQVLFDSPTVEKMAAAIKDAQSVGHQLGEHNSKQSTDVVPAGSAEPPVNFTPFPKEEVERSVPERFEKIVVRYPDRIAVKTDHEAVTYSQLNAMANRLARAILARRGTVAEAVAILMDNGARLMAAMLAVLKTGKFFVLLDRSSPPTRLAHILEDSQAHLLISERQYAKVTRHVDTADSHLLDFDSISSQVAEENLSLSISPNSLAAIIYTSGSIGEPKGVICAHLNLLHQIMLFANAYKLSECDKLLLTTSGTANAVSIEFLALLNGAALLPFDVQSDGVNRLVKWLLDEKISICWVGSPLFRNICHALNGEETFPDVRILRLASEASYKSDIELYKQHFSPECVLINGLSNTESGLICLCSIDFRTEIAGQEVPVGYPVEDKEILLLNDAGEEVGVNEVGEIAVRSRYLSQGYWHRPELTASKFRPDPNGSGQRIYLSGDLGFMRPDGCLIHKGRKDFRVKIRGYGVEPADIEKVLNSHAAVGQAVVVARAKETSEARLVAYYTSSGLRTPSVSELRSFLRDRLPDFMIPSAFVKLESLPLSHSGKVDRRVLPDPNNVRPELAAPYLSPRSQVERKLVTIWEDVLDIRPVGVNDGFFDLGGDSLSATRVISQVIKHFQMEIPLQALFQSATIAAMTSLIAQHQCEPSKNAKPDHGADHPLLPISREDLLPLSYSQQRLWFLDQLEPASFSYNLFSAYRLKGELNVAALEQRDPQASRSPENGV
jgi:amino acid adenylation domain-containing protein